MKMFVNEDTIVSLEKVRRVDCCRGNMKEDYRIRVHYTDGNYENINCGSGKYDGDKVMKHYFEKIIKILQKEG